MTSNDPPRAPAEPRSFRSFYVHLSEGPSGAGHLITDAEDAFDAAMRFAERWGPDEGEELKVQVVDGFTGERCCYAIDLSTGEIGPC